MIPGLERLFSTGTDTDINIKSVHLYKNALKFVIAT